ncbi:MAG TPA: fumarate hydratase [Thermoplasmata archaeon]|nr:fumarate hydratase [Thermoplasmata archaeon]
MFDREAFIGALVRGMRDGAIELPPDVRERLEVGHEAEKSEIARMQLRAILDNVRLAHDEGLPLCQDTGVQTFFVRAGYDFPYLAEVVRAIPEAVERATREVPLRPNTVDPFTGVNPGNNLGYHMPAVTVEMEEGDGATVTVLPKGGGSENMSALWMLTPAEGIEEMRRRILEHIQWAAGKPCPPVILGIGIGGGADIVMKLAKKALLRPLGSASPVPEIAALERRLLEEVNAIGVGPMGLGGSTTALAVHIEHTARHPATFPVGLVVQCWCDRRAVIEIGPDGEVIG